MTTFHTDTEQPAAPRLLPAPAATTDPPRAHRAPAKKKRTRRSWTAWLLLLLVLGGAGYGGYRLVDQRVAASSQLALDTVVLTAVPVPVGSPDAAVVSTVEVVAGQSVPAGTELATIQLTAGDGVTNEVTLTAPNGGTVVTVDAQPGSVVRAGESVVTLYDPAAMTFETQVPVEDVEGLAAGMTATISGPGLTAPVQATVDRVLPVIDGDGGA
ncbi:HlyD family secretion protein [Klenkia soli]|uniref:HlyD family secretion protein n=1 Tax=Klenkia soli TaxID=1052260 RepID=A0A1H0UTP0_9ACTN|nr:HlyD family secretion protein [Klenkia soli]SDP69649.1 HlyD family secretion protein [Klenkia soli]